MNTYKDEEIIYCNHCGSADKRSAVVCTECGKNIHIKYRPFYDFLKKHTGDEIKGTLTDSLFSYIKNFLFSHLYGVSLSVMIVASSVSAIYAAEPHIEKVTEIKKAPVQTVVSAPAEVEEVEPPKPLSEDDFYYFNHLLSNYDAFADMLRSSESYWDTSAGEYGSASELYAENNIDGFSYGGVHELISNPISMYSIDGDPALSDINDIYSDYFSDRYLDTSSALQGEGCSSSVAKALFDDGYRVAECNYVLCEAAGDYDYNSHSGSGYEKKLVYRFVFVENDGNWYIADDRLINRVNM